MTVVTSCASSSKPAPTPSASARTPSGACSNLLTDPTCRVLWGASADGTSVSAIERATGKKFDFLYFFNAIDTGELPTADEREAVAKGQALHINLESRQFAKPGHPEVRWAAVADGAFDTALRQAATGLAGLHKPFFITFDHEADSKAKVAARGTPKEFIAAWRHIHNVFRAAGATQAIWTWVVTGYPPNYSTAQALYPGNDVVDWISWDPYDSRGCQSGDVGSAPSQTFAETAQPFYQWLATTGARAGISLEKPYMISETGSAFIPSDPKATAAFYTSIPAGLRQLPRIRAVTIWDQKAGSCDYRVDGISRLQPALRTAAEQLAHSKS
jgi:hypothetical protein